MPPTAPPKPCNTSGIMLLKSLAKDLTLPPPSSSIRINPSDALVILLSDVFPPPVVPPPDVFVLG